ncbi:glycosyltransferase family 4 protein [Alcanivorax sp. S6407]|uniref:glycosyltransferase family 4 protein n=1 Tax=Alcanivorax sp. S6407 TaxID=2926424 RepID=UPI001FF5DB78|nr:glycosyltransferase family 4 protein [Alcanivorax sp. S6407]MCK0155053.1 glycosyltransferase family 4 protein [Alcanivorax sp. S6407]
MAMTPAVWFPTIRTNTGTDVYTLRLIKGLNERGIKAEASWLPLRAEYAPWTAPLPSQPKWANIIHTNTWFHHRFIPAQLPLVATMHHSVHHPSAAPYKGKLRTLYHNHWIAPMERQVLIRAKKVIAVSQFVADTTRQTLADVPIEVIYNGVDTEIFKPYLQQKTETRPFRLLYVGSWISRKGVDLLAPIMRELGDNFELLYTGGPASDKDKPSMPANMHDIGRLDGDREVARAMQQADALLFPSRSEGFGLVAAEAIACRLPVIATRGSSLIEVVTHGTTGLLCPADNVSAFTQAARQLANTHMDNGAIEDHVKERFSIERSIEATIKVYYQVLEGER